METTGVDFPKDQPYDAIAPDSDDILMATQEAIELFNNPLPLDKNQQRMKELRPDTFNECSLSRTSAAFLERYQDLL